MDAHGRANGVHACATADDMTGFVFIVPGRLDQFTGGYLVDLRVVDGARARGRPGLVI